MTNDESQLLCTLARMMATLCPSSPLAIPLIEWQQRVLADTGDQVPSPFVSSIIPGFGVPRDDYSSRRSLNDE